MTEKESGALVERAPSHLEPAAQPSPLAAILSNPEQLATIPIETVERLFALHREELAGQARQLFFAAFHRVRSRMRPVTKRATNTQTSSNYARVEEIQRMLDPLLAEEGFSYSVSTVEPVVDDTMRVCLTLRHVGGHEERHYLDAPVDDKGPKGAPTKTRLHGMGSTLTYCGRQLLTQVFGVMLTKDDDGNAGGASEEVITRHQAADLHALIEEVGADLGRFCFHMQVASIEDIPARKFKLAVAGLEAKRQEGTRKEGAS